ncbi:MAG: dihydrolipoamide acetyltransferase family protein [Chitinophagales bacterium]|jgi:pyruvate dehydrogenase E2 component (dihydrolipoamide acetyltransferase)|nr:2-oxo acid dehydrogenase subunit E2 [Sphingobacteriales bacterium]
MAERLNLPRMSDTMEEGVIANMLIKVGDVIKPGTIVAEVETDKATMDFESFQSGEVLYVAAKSGDSVPVNGLLAILGKKGEDFQSLLSETPPATSPAKEEAKEDAKPAVVAEVVSPSVQTISSSDQRVKASPLAKSIAKEKGINLSNLSGTGEDGRIVKKDVESYQGSGAQDNGANLLKNSPIGQESFEEIPLSQMRKVIAKRLAESMYTAPHFYLTIEVNMDNAILAREQMNAVSPVKISYNDLVIKACALALKKHPYANASWLGDKIRINHHVNIGMAVAVPDGLVVPVIRSADMLSLSQIAASSKSYAEKAKNKQILPDEMKGNTFSISNLGMMGIEEFTAIINTPDACILAVGAMKEIAGVKNGQIVPTSVMKMTLSCDHRVVDGAVGSAFLADVRKYLENPVTMMV